MGVDLAAYTAADSDYLTGLGRGADGNGLRPRRNVGQGSPRKIAAHLLLDLGLERARPDVLYIDSRQMAEGAERRLETGLVCSDERAGDAHGLDRGGRVVAARLALVQRLHITACPLKRECGEDGRENVHLAPVWCLVIATRILARHTLLYLEGLPPTFFFLCRASVLEVAALTPQVGVVDEAVAVAALELGVRLVVAHGVAIVGVDEELPSAPPSSRAPRARASRASAFSAPASARPSRASSWASRRPVAEAKRSSSSRRGSCGAEPVSPSSPPPSQ